jgi:hypothetical protein
LRRDGLSQSGFAVSGRRLVVRRVISVLIRLGIS